MLWRNHREVGILTALDNVADECSIIIKRSITLTYDVVLFLLSRQVNNILVLKVGNTVDNLTVRSLDEAQLVNLCIYTKRRYKSDVRTFRALDRTQTAIVSVMHVTHLESGTLTRQTSRTKCRQTTLVSNLGKRVSLVHELRQRVCAEERVDYTRYGLGIDKIGRGEHFIVAHVHPLPYSAAHTCQSDRELIAQLLADSTHTTVRQVVDIVDCSL